MSFLDQYDAAAHTEKFPLVRNWMKNAPLEFFEELRKDRPILETPECTLLAIYDDVVETLLDTAAFTVQLYEDKMGTYLMAQDDTPVHYREKAIMQSILNRNDLPRIRQQVGRWAAEYLDSAGGQMDVIAGLTRRIPITLVQEYMGFAGSDPADIAKWSLWNQWDTFHNQPFDGNTNYDEIHQKALAVNVELGKYLGELVPKRLADIKAGTAPDDIVCRLLRSAFPPAIDFPMDRLVRNIGGLLIGTIETTSQATAQATQQLLRRPDQLILARAAATRDIQAFDGFVFEALRFDPITPYLFRRCASNYVIARGTPRETTIEAGTIVLQLILSAMFDATSQPDPYAFNPHRNLHKAFHFGLGLHECLGRYIGYAMIPEIVRQLILRPNVRAVGAIDFRGTPFPDYFEVAWS